MVKMVRLHEFETDEVVRIVYYYLVSVIDGSDSFDPYITISIGLEYRVSSDVDVSCDGSMVSDTGYSAIERGVDDSTIRVSKAVWTVEVHAIKVVACVHFIFIE